MKIQISLDALYIRLQEAIEESPIIPPCQVTDPEIWYADKDDIGGNYRLAKQMCTQCPAMMACATYAIAAEEPFGCWGGLSPRERQKMRTAQLGRKSGRPKSSLKI